MSNLLLHIKDAYYFEVPRAFWTSRREKPEQFPDWLVRNDADFQSKEADSLIGTLNSFSGGAGNTANLKEKWEAWKESPSNFARPLDVYLEMEADALVSRANKWASRNAKGASDKLKAYLAESDSGASEEFGWFADLRSDREFMKKWAEAKASQNSSKTVSDYLKTAKWDESKVAEYNDALSGKVLIPQPFGTLRNAYEPESGFCISKYMIIELGVALLLVAAFSWLGKRVGSGDAPKGKVWNLLEGLMEYVRVQVFEPAMGKEDSRRFMPLLASLFVFIFGLNLAGMIPFLGSPTATLACTGALALVVFVVGLVWGLRAMGPIGYLKNLCPSMGLPPALSVIIVPMLWTIEFISLFMKHGILALRLLANMVAGHAVLLGLMGLAVGAHALAMHFGLWGLLAGATGASMVAMSLLELFIAFLQAAMFTFLAGLFISSSIHHH